MIGCEERRKHSVILRSSPRAFYCNMDNTSENANYWPLSSPCLGLRTNVQPIFDSLRSLLAAIATIARTRSLPQVAPSYFARLKEASARRYSSPTIPHHLRNCLRTVPSLASSSTERTDLRLLTGVLIADLVFLVCSLHSTPQECSYEVWPGMNQRSKAIPIW